MEKRLVKVAPLIHDLKDEKHDSQEALFSVGENTLLKLDQNEATVSPSPLVLKALKKAIESKSLNRHPDSDSRRLRRKLSHYNGVDFESIACYGSESSAMESITRTYMYPGLDALIAWPNDNPFPRYASSTGARVINAQFENPFEPGIEELISGITPKTRIIYISNPNGITGALFTDAEIVFLLSYASDTMVAVDESYFEFSGITLAEMVEQYSNLIILRSFSKAFALAGLNISYIMTDPQNMRFIKRLSTDKYPNMLSQIAAEAALDDINYISTIVHHSYESKKMIFDTLSRLNYEFRISPANFFIIKTADPKDLAETLAKNNIYVKSLSGLAGFENYLRITIGTPTQMGILLDILSQLSEKQATETRTIANRIKIKNNNREYIAG